MIRLSKVPVKFIVRGLKPIVILLLDYGADEPVPYEEWKVSCFILESFTITEGGLRTCGLYGGASDLSGDGIVAS